MASPPITTQNCNYHKCWFTGCERSKARCPDLHFFRFPTKWPKVCEQWVKNCANDNLTSLSEKTLSRRLVCEMHFIDDCFTSTMKTHLKKNAVPTLLSLDDGIGPQTPKQTADEVSLNDGAVMTPRSSEHKVIDMSDDENADYTDCRVMVDGNGEVVRNDEGGYCMLNIKDKSVIVLPPGEESDELISKLLLQSEEQSIEPVTELELNVKPEHALSSIEKESNEITSSFWFVSTPNIEGCRNCTELLINIVGSEAIQKMLNHRNTSKKKVWQVIAKKMIEHGYKVPGATLAVQGEKAHQKWRNIEKIYVKFKNHLRETSNDPDRLPPPYFEAMDKVLSKKYDSQPKFIFDSLSMNNASRRTDSPRPEISDDIDDPVGMFTEHDFDLGYDVGTEEVTQYPQSKRTVLKSQAEFFLTEIKSAIVEQCAKDRETQTRHHEEIKEILEKQIQQREDMLSILRTLVKHSEGKKRKRDDS